MRYYYNDAFRWKMGLFLAAVIIHFGLQANAARRADQNQEIVNHGASIIERVGALCSLLLWLSVGLAGRAIGYI